ncbi:MAG: kynureninase/PvdN C-terminal domain-containing protein [Paracoccaceae bacterium]
MTDQLVVKFALFIQLVEQSRPGLRLASPRDPAKRGSQMSFAFEQGNAGMQAMITWGVIGDFRAPNLIRFGFTPLYVGEQNLRRAVEILSDIMVSNAWSAAEFRTKAKVT